MDWTGDKDAPKGGRLDGGTGPVGTQFGPVVPELLLVLVFEQSLEA